MKLFNLLGLLLVRFGWWLVVQTNEGRDLYVEADEKMKEFVFLPNTFTLMTDDNRRTVIKLAFFSLAYPEKVSKKLNVETHK